MRNQLIIFYGASSGMGKSTLSEFLFDQLRRHNVAVRWVHEDDVAHMPAFAATVQGFHGGEPFDPFPTLLQATTALVTEWSQSPTVIITDSVLPYWDWLFPGAPTAEQMTEFTVELAQILEPLQPLLIYLDGDIGAALRRAVAQRGQQWLDELIPWMNTWQQNIATPIQDIAGFTAYSEARRSLVRQLLNQWPHACLRLDSVSNSLEHCQQEILEHLGLANATTTEAVSLARLQSYVGIYAASTEDDRADKRLEVRLVDDALYINLYWPNGCRLVPEGDATFRLQATSEWIELLETNADLPRELLYFRQGQSYRYYYQHEES